MSSKNKVILIVDDDVDVLNYLKTLLENVFFLWTEPI